MTPRSFVSTASSSFKSEFGDDAGGDVLKLGLAEELKSRKVPPHLAPAPRCEEIVAVHERIGIVQNHLMDHQLQDTQRKQMEETLTQTEETLASLQQDLEYAKKEASSSTTLVSNNYTLSPMMQRVPQGPFSHVSSLEPNQSQSSSAHGLYSDQLCLYVPLPHSPLLRPVVDIQSYMSDGVQVDQSPPAPTWQPMDSQPSQDPRAAYKQYLDAKGQVPLKDKQQPTKTFGKARSETPAITHLKSGSEQSMNLRLTQCVCKDHQLPEDDTRTTVMIKNIPGNYNRELLLDLVNGIGFAGSYDFVYCPRDFNKGASLGYAFLNMASPKDAQDIMARLEGHCWEHYKGSKVCEMAYGDPLQGCDAYVNRYRNSPMMHDLVPHEYKPVLFVNGLMTPLPPATKKISPPRQFKQPSGVTKADGE
jgi:hypothetical protein